MSIIELKVPDIGGSTDVNVAEVYVKAGDTINIDDNLLMLETDKATMEVPSTAAGRVVEVVAKVGSKLNEGDLILKLESIAAAAVVAEKPQETSSSPIVSSPVATNNIPKVDGEIECDVVVIGAGPGG